MDRNGWVSFDFLMASLLILLTIPSLVSIIEERINTVNSVDEISEARVLAENLAEDIEMVYSGGRGCSIIFKLPAKVSNKHYKIKINSTGVYVIFFRKNWNCTYNTHDNFEWKIRFLCIYWNQIKLTTSPISMTNMIA